MSSPEQRPGDDGRDDEKRATVRPDAEHRAGGPTDGDEARRGAPTPGGMPDGEDAGSAPPELAPIPPEGTAAPADATRVFGQPPPSSPYARILAGHARGDRTRASGQPPAGVRPGGEGGVPTSPHHVPEPRPSLSEEDTRRLRNRGRYALALGLAALLASVIAFPLGPILGIAAIVLGVLTRRTARTAQVDAPGAKPGIVLGIVATAFSTILLATMLVFWSEVTEYQQCMSGANTQTARETCQEQLVERITERVAPTGTMPR